MESIGTLLEKILSHYEKKEYGYAERLVDDLLAANPNFHRGLFLKGVLLEETGRVSEAETYYGKAGNLFTLWVRLAMQLENVDPQRALTYFERAGGMDRKNNVIWLHKGLLYERIGRRDEARKCFRNLSAAREVISRVAIPIGFMLFLIGGAMMMIRRGEKTLASLVIASAVFCLFWLKRDAGTAIQMLRKKRQYRY